MLSALRLTPPVAESSAMALARYTDHTAQGGSLIGAPSVSLFGEYLLDFQNTAQSLTSALYGELEVIFSRIDVHDISPSHNVPKTTSRSSSSKSRDPSYIEPAYNWLLTNLHNPYPSKATLTKIARKAKSDVKSVEAWFIDARGRIGWTTLRKTHFRNKQADIVDAATCFFVQLDEKRPLYATLELEFTQVEVAAKNLYADKFQETALVATLDVAVKDLTPEMKQQAQEEALKRRQAASSYPSPLHSPERSPEPESVEFSPLEQDVDLATTLPDAISRLKRRSSSPENDANTSTDRPAKRARLQTPPPAATGLPSPTPLSHEPLRRKSPSHPPPINSTPLPTISRKRRLSDADGQGAAKRPCNLSARPRLQTVSDPLPMATSSSFEIADMDNWFNTNFGSFSPATVDPFDDTLGLDLDFYTYSDVDTPSTATGSLAAQSRAYHWLHIKIAMNLIKSCSSASLS
ncbi:hypothetical protein C0991_003248 [Blastosporella zonata]|nr:hypothetical protein C0991_003248 [Blastosporella zonata]